MLHLERRQHYFAAWTAYSNGAFAFGYVDADSAVENWFRDETAVKGINLRKVVRLSKMFCRSRDTWTMPSGLLQTVLCDEQL